MNYSAPLSDRIGRIEFHASIADADAATELKPRIEEFAWKLIPPLLENICEGVIGPDQHLILRRLHLDLGKISAENFEQDALVALEAALRDALLETIQIARMEASDEGRIISIAAARQAHFFHWLQTGTAPGGTSGGKFDPTGNLLFLLEDQPAELAASLRRHGRRQSVLERLVLQIDTEGLQALLARLAPADAEQILALHADVIAAHALELEPPLDRVSEPELERMLWITTFKILLQDAGTHFNRRRFLAQLLSHEADELGLDYEMLVRLLADAAANLRQKKGGESGLSVLLIELLEELEESPDAHILAKSDVENDPIKAARAGDFSHLLAAIRAAADQPSEMESWIEKCDPPLFQGLLRQIASAEVSFVLVLLNEIEMLGRAKPLSRFSVFQPADLNMLTLSYFLNASGLAQDVQEFAGYLIAKESSRAGINISVLARALKEAGSPSKLSGSLRAAIQAILDAPDSQDVDNEPAVDRAIAAARKGSLEPLLNLLRTDENEAALARIDTVLFEKLVAHLRSASKQAIFADVAAIIAIYRDQPFLASPISEFERLVRRIALATLLDNSRRFHHRRWITAFLQALADKTGVSKARIHAYLAQGLSTANLADTNMLAKVIATSGTNDALDALHKASRNPAMLRQLSGRLSQRERRRMLAIFAPAHAEAVAASLDMLARLNRLSRLTKHGAGNLDELLFSLVIGWLDKNPAGRLDMPAMMQHLLSGIASEGDMPLEQISERINAGLELLDERASKSAAYAAIEESMRLVSKGMANPQKAKIGKSGIDQRQRIEFYLRTGRPPDRGSDLVKAAKTDAAWLRVLLMRLAREAPANIPSFLERLLDWLLPEELAAVLQNGPVGEMGATAARNTRDWHAHFDAVLRGEHPQFSGRPNAETTHLDELVRIADWIKSGGVDRDGRNSPPLTLLEGLADRSDVELAWLFQAATHEQVINRLRQAIYPLDIAGQKRLIAHLAPWAIRANGPLRDILSGLEPKRKMEVWIRSAAAALDGLELDLADLSRPLPRFDRQAEMKQPVAAKIGQDDPDIDRLIAWLNGAHASAADAELFRGWLSQALDRDDPKLSGWLLGQRKNAAAYRRWTKILADDGLTRMLHLLAPEKAGHFVDTAMLLSAASRRATVFGAPRVEPAMIWLWLFELADEPAIGLPQVTELLVAKFSGGEDARTDAIKTSALQMAKDAGHLAIAASLRRISVRRGEKSEHPPNEPPADQNDDIAEEEPPADIDLEEPVFVSNAGLVLLGPYLPALFERLELLSDKSEEEDEDDQEIVGVDAISRAVHLLQYMADGRLDAEEHELVLNKILCGVQPAQPILASIEPDSGDLEICDGLLGAIIENWSAISGTSVSGLRETFLQRDGRLLQDDDIWQLQVQRTGVDVLVDQIPWGFSNILHRWMERPVQVTW